MHSFKDFFEKPNRINFGGVMRVIMLYCFVLWSSIAWSQEWTRGSVTQAIWLDQGGFHIEIDDVDYLLMRDAKIVIDDIEHEIPDRMAWLTKNSRVRFSHEGFRIYALIVEWRN